MIRLLMAVFTTAVFSVSVFAFQGTLDRSFDSDGMVSTAIYSHSSSATAVAIQSDGKIVATGQLATGGSYKIPTVRYNTDGSLDSSFSYDGIALDYIGEGSFANAVSIQTDGKIVVAGATYGSVRDFALFRYNADGLLDNSFGNGGKVSTDFFGSSETILDMEIQSDGKILVVGLANGSANGADFALARYNTDGSLDNTFGTGGKITTDFANSSDLARSVVIQSDGKIVVSGQSRPSGVLTSFAVARYFSDGTLDTTFDGDGKVVTAIRGDVSVAEAVAVDSQGKIYAAGYSGVGTNQKIVGVKYLANGSLDSTFGSSGIYTGPNGRAFDIHVPSDTTVLIAGSVINGKGRASNSDFVVQKLNNDGSLDWRWGRGGNAQADFGGNDYGQAMAIDKPRGEIVVGGYIHNSVTGDYEFGVARFIENFNLLN